jgi:chaperone BCS1
MKRGLVLGSIALRRRLLVSLEIHNRDRAYDWFLTWMAHQSQAQLTLRTQRWLKSHHLSLVTATRNESNGNSGVSFNLVAGPGVHWFKYQGAWMQVRENHPSTDSGRTLIQESRSNANEKLGP